MTDDDRLFAFRTNMVVTASAGTGKTFRLVTLYVLLALGLTSKGQRDDEEATPPEKPTRMAATTFSRAAALEIRERVERLLSAVATGRRDAWSEPYMVVLDSRAEKTRSPPIASAVMRARARAALDELPHALIDTLHGLAGRIVRAFALELGMTPEYAVLDEEKARASIDAATEEVLSGALQRGNRAALDLLDSAGGLSMTRRRVAELLDRADEEGAPIEELVSTDFVEASRDVMERLRDLCAALVAENGRAFGEPARAAERAARAWLEVPSGGEPRRARVVERELAAAFEPLFSRRSPTRPTPAEQAFLAYREGIRGETHAARARRLAAFAAVAAELTPRTSGVKNLVAEIAERRSAERRRLGALGFGDLLRIARDALRDHPAWADITRAMFDVLLVDEFQDTSRVQRDLVYLLREKATNASRRRAGTLPTAADLEPSGLLVVGDRKQSIYGFRGADVTVFATVCAELAGRPASEALLLGTEFEVPERANAELVTLFENRRSDPHILAFVNLFAAEDFDGSSAYPFDIHYAKSEHLVSPADRMKHEDAGAVPRVVVVDDAGQSSEAFSPLVRGASGPMREALIAAGLVDRAVREGPFGDLPFGDVAILARRRATLPLLEMALARLDIPYVVAGRGLFETREVRDVFAMLRLVLDPGDRHALATVLRGPAVGLSDLALTLLSEPGRGLMRPDEWFGSKKGAADRLPLAEKECLRRFETHFRELRRVALGLGSADAIRYAIEKLDWDRVVAALPHAPQHLGNVERLIGLATKHGGSLPSFVRWLEQQIADQGDESEAAALNESDDAVALMTIHASKGLEFRAVVLVDMGVAVRATPLTLAVVSPRAGRSARLAVRHVHERGGSLYTPEAVELSKENMARELAERRRLTYVAMTRAKDRLFLLVPPLPANGSAAATMKRVLPELATMPGVAIESAVPYLLRLDPSRSLQAGRGVHPMQALPSPVRLPVSPGPLGISTTPLATFAQCPRRYRFLHELALEPPPFADSVSERRREDQDDRRALGTAAHRVLERWPLVRWGMPTDPSEIVEKLLAEGLMNLAPDLLAGLADNIAGFLGGPYATEVRTRDGVVYREERFLVPIACEGGELHLRGAIDLLVDWRDGSADVLDYKSSFRPELTSHEFQLRAYAVAVRRRFGISRIRVGILNLAASNPPTLSDVDAADLDSFEQILCDLRARFMSARASFDFAGVERPECEALRCGFVAACHSG